MKFAQPEAHDFIFEHGNFHYAIGYQDDEFMTFAMSATVKSGTNWAWVESDQLFGKDLSKWGGAVGFLKYFLAKCNEILGSDDDLPPPLPVDEFEKLLHIVQYGLKFEDNIVKLK